MMKIFAPSFIHCTGLVLFTLFMAADISAVKETINVGDGYLNTVVDISHYIRVKDFGAVKRDGILGVIHKCTQGEKYVDPMYASRRTTFQARGFLWGAYHFGVGGVDGKVQARHFVRSVGGDIGKVLLILDLETNPGGKTMSRKEAEDFVVEFYKLTGNTKPLMIYGNAYFLRGYKSPILTSCPLWIAAYNAKPSIPAGWKDWTLWQYTDGKDGNAPHSVNGIGSCDRSKFKGSAKELTDFWVSTKK